MLVFRYENKNGVGPYTADWEEWGTKASSFWLASSHAGEKHPSPRMDGIEKSGKNYVCGCPSAAALSEWFSGWEAVLLRNGFVVKTYDIPDEEVFIGKSGLQVVFKRG